MSEIFLENLHIDCLAKQTLKSMFEHYGTISDIKIIDDKAVIQFTGAVKDINIYDVKICKNPDLTISKSRFNRPPSDQRLIEQEHYTKIFIRLDGPGEPSGDVLRKVFSELDKTGNFGGRGPYAQDSYEVIDPKSIVVHYGTVDGARSALHKLNGREIGGYKIHVRSPRQ